MKKTLTVPDVPSEPFLDFGDSEADVQGKILATIADVRADIPERKLPHLVSGIPRHAGEYRVRENPSCVTETVGRTCFATPETVNEAVTAVKKSPQAREWARIPLHERARYVRTVAEFFRMNRILFIALSMLEAGKQPALADAEVCEAVDLLERYAAAAEFWEDAGNAMLGSPKGKKNSVAYFPYGPRVPVCASIQPWNFPVAIAAGPTAAALVSGHSVLFKPAEQTSVTGYFVAQAFYEAGIPPEVFHFLPGNGETVGKALVEHPDVSGIAFTGSVAVCNKIREALWASNKENRGWERRAYALESGGKNAMIVLPDADINRVVEDAADSAFGYQGQRCSALSRLIVVDEKGLFFEELMERLGERTKNLNVGPPEDFKNFVGPLIDAAAVEKVSFYRNLAEKEGEIYAEGSVPEGLCGYFVPPVLAGGIDPFSRVAQEEIFGPVLLAFQVKTIEEAVRMTNNTAFALTASLHTRNPDIACYLQREIESGVVYVRDKTTGAVPGQQDFGGGKLSGNGTKAGSFMYLLPFLFPVNISENTLQCGIPME